MSRSPSAFLAALSLGLALLLAACGGGGGDGTDDAAGSGSATTTDETPTSDAADDDAPAASSLDACATLSDAQVEQATGHKVTKKGPGGGQGFATSTCGWEVEGDTPGVADFTVSIKSPGGRSRFDVLAKEMTAVPGLGDAAFQQGDSIWAVTGDELVVLDFALLTSDVDDPSKAVRPLIEAILAKL